MADDMGALRTEILESEKTRYELLKWKLALVAALGAAGLGIGNAAKSDGAGHLDYLLCLIPMVCLYVDALCIHMNLRILVIARYLRTVPSRRHSWEGYEKLVHAARSMPRTHPAPNGRLSAFALEDWALRWSTTVLSALLIAYAGLGHAGTAQRPCAALLAGACGLVASVLLPLAWRRVHPYRLVALMVVIALVPYVTLTSMNSPPKGTEGHAFAWTLFLTSGMLGLLLTGILEVIYRWRYSAINALPPPHSAKAGTK